MKIEKPSKIIDEIIKNQKYLEKKSSYLQKDLGHLQLFIFIHLFLREFVKILKIFFSFMDKNFKSLKLSFIIYKLRISLK